MVSTVESLLLSIVYVRSVVLIALDISGIVVAMLDVPMETGLVLIVSSVVVFALLFVISVISVEMSKGLFEVNVVSATVDNNRVVAVAISVPVADEVVLG